MTKAYFIFIAQWKGEVRKQHLQWNNGQYGRIEIAAQVIWNDEEPPSAWKVNFVLFHSSAT